MKKKTKSSKKRPQIVHAYQANPYALQRRNATATTMQPELVPVIVQPPPRRRRISTLVRDKARQAKQRATERLTDKQFLAEAGLAAAGAGASAVATGWAAGRGWNPGLVGAGTMVTGGLAAVLLPTVWRGVGVGMTGWGVGQVFAYLMQMRATKELELQKRAVEQQRALEQQRAEQQRALEQAAAQKALPPPSRPSNAAFGPAISDAFANARTYGHYGRADDEERMTDLDLVLG
jgi:hypothetical protein